MALYEMAPIYHGMVERLWNARCTYAEQGDEKMRQVVKAVLNASFGKWAQLARRWTPVPHILPIRPYTQWFEVDANGDLVQYRAIGWNVDRMETLQEEQSDTFPAITAYINSHGRAYLWKLMQIAGDGNVYYVDTDALIVNQLGFDALYAAGKMGMTQIGMLKLEDMPKHLRIHGRQSYEMDGVLTISGASGKTLKSGDAFIEQLVAPPIGYYLTKHNGDGTVGEAPGTERRIARVRVTRSYNTGDVQEDGTVKPIRFGG
jgi:hypothetical protein